MEVSGLSLVALLCLSVSSSGEEEVVEWEALEAGQGTLVALPVGVRWVEACREWVSR